MNEQQAACRQLRRDFSKSGWALLIYYGVMNASVFAVAVIGVFVLMLRAAFGSSLAPVQLEEMLVQSILSNGWGYLLAIVIGGALMLLWKKKEFCLKTIWKQGRPMTLGAFLLILPVFMGGQAVSQLITPILDYLLGLVGLSLSDTIEMSSPSTDTFSMFLYIGLLAPISEEILFRGLILRQLEPYGKKFAIFASSFLFGIFHGNLVQTPYAFLVGLVLGYVAMEFNVLWAMVLHMINNLLLGDTLLRLIASLSELTQEIIFAVVIWGFALGAVVVLIYKRKAVSEFLFRRKMHPLCLKSFFTAPGILVLTAVLVGNMLLTLLLQMI